MSENYWFLSHYTNICVPGNDINYIVDKLEPKFPTHVNVHI